MPVIPAIVPVGGRRPIRCRGLPTPAHARVFVLHDMFAVPFDEIAPIVGRSPAAARRLAGLARRRVQGTGTTVGAAAGSAADRGSGAAPAGDRSRQRQIVDAFLAASRGGDFDTLLAMLDPDVVLRSDTAAVKMGR